MKHLIIFSGLFMLIFLTAQDTRSIAIEPESFKFQPGAIKSLTPLDKSEWILVVDLLTPNPDRKPRFG
jgi:hypothetical protein